MYQAKMRPEQFNILTRLTLSHRVAHDEIGPSGECVNGPGIHHQLISLHLAVHVVTGGHGIVVLVSTARLMVDITCSMSRTADFLEVCESNGCFVCVYLQYKDFRLSYKALAPVSFEQSCDILDADLSIVGVNVIVLTVAQEDAHKAVCVGMVGLSSW